MTPRVAPVRDGREGAGHHQAWLDLLDRLDQDAQRLEQRARAGEEPGLPDWTTPDLGPLPAELRPRALAVIRRQEAAMRAIRDALADTFRQRALADRIGGLASPDGPVYIDARA